MPAVEPATTPGEAREKRLVLRDRDLKAQHICQTPVKCFCLPTCTRELGNNRRAPGLQRAVPGNGAIAGQAANSLPICQQLQGLTRIRLPDQRRRAAVHALQLLRQTVQQFGP